MIPNRVKYLLFFLLFPIYSIAQETKEFYVSQKGNDMNHGTILQPFRTIERAQQAVRETDKSTFQGTISVQLRRGEYFIGKPLQFSKADGGNAHCRVNYSAWQHEKVILHSGYKVSGKWKTEQNGICSIHLDSIPDMRQLYVNELRMPRASTKTIRQSAWSADKKGFLVPKGNVFQLKSGKTNIEFVQETQWRLYRQPIDRILDSGSNYEFIFNENEFEPNQKANLQTWISPEKMFTLENNLAFLDAENEWFFDAETKTLYFKPAKNIRIEKAEIFIPLGEKLIEIQGLDNNPVENLHFSGISFRHSNWLLPSTKGIAPLQSTILVNENGPMNGRIPGCITANFVKNISFTNNRFEHLGATALYLENGISQVRITGNVFFDISAAAIHLGNIEHESANDGKPETSDITITNNVLRDIAVEYSGSAAISAYYISNTQIAHNDINGTGYSAISTGWGWSEKCTSMHDNRVDSNRIFNVMQRCWDGSPVYTLSKQDNSGLVGNYVGCLNMAQHGSAGLYHDQGSAGFTDENNVIELERPDLLAYMLNDSYGNIVRNTYTNTGNSVVFFYDYHTKKPDDILLEKFHIFPDSKWPEAARNIIEHAGLEPDFKHLASTVRPASLVKYEKAYFESPFVFDGEHVSIEAENYVQYQGLEQSNYSWIGVKAWFTGYSGSRALMTIATTISDHPNFSGMPRLGYSIQFEKAGDYYLYIRAKGDKDLNAVSFGLNDQKLGEVDGWGKEFSWQKPVKLTIVKAGVHRLDIWMKSEGFYLDKIMVSTSPATIETNRLEMGSPESQHKISIPENANYLRITQ